MKKLLSLALVAVMVLSTVVSSFAITQEEADAIPTRSAITHEDRENYHGNKEDYVLDAWFSDSTATENSEGVLSGQFSLNFKNNFGVWASRIFFVYPPCITVTKIQHLYNKKDAYDPDYTLYTRDDADSNQELGNESYKTFMDIVALEQPDVTYDIPGYEGLTLKQLIDDHGYKFGILLMVSEQHYYTKEDEDEDNYISFVNFKAVDGPVYTIDYTYDPTLNTTGETEIPIINFASNIDTFFSYGDDGDDDGDMVTNGYNGVIHVPSQEGDTPVSTDPTITVSDAEITVGDTEATFTMEIANNPGLYGVAGFLTYNKNIKITDVACGTVFPSLSLGGPTASGNEKMLNQRIGDWCDKSNSLYNKTWAPVLNDAGVSHDDYGTRIMAEIDSLEVNNTSNGTFITFKVDTSELEVGEYEIAFVPEPDSIINVDADNVEFKIVNGTLTVNSCDHNWSTTGTTAATCTENAVKHLECTKCGNTKDEPVANSALGHDFQETGRDAADCTNAEVIHYGCKRCTATEDRPGEAAKGHTEVEIPAVAATCTEKGSTAGTKCSVCDEILKATSETSALGHDWVQGETTGDCGSIGTIHYSCSRCIATKTEEGAYIDHAWSETDRLNATCTEDGYVSYQCSKCLATKTDTITKTGHDYNTEVVEPTCTEQGYTVYTCKKGDHTYNGNVTAALGHYMHETDRVAATCTADGYYDEECSRCSATNHVVLTALGHDYQDSTTDPTCTEKGYTTHTCSRCEDTYRDSETDPLGHDYKNTVTDPTCTEKGYTTHTCSRCNDAYTDSETDPLGHDYKDTVTAPTCTQKGYTTHTCSRCGDTYVDSYTDPLNHEYDEGVYTAPTCTEKGYWTYTCVRGDDSYTEDGEDALGHDFEDGEEVSVEPTCTEDGYVGHKCTRCDAVDVDEVIPATGHSFDNGVITKAPTVDAEGVKTYTCEVCGFQKTEAIAKLEAPADTDGDKADDGKTDGTNDGTAADSTAKPTGDTLAIVIFAASVALVAGAAVVIIKKKRIFGK